mmetsp:Transcript_28893/g.66805  ORF Transcript_28893/g.66805 Transcript_28893/m.66805 type:complete len:398 (+) Transcript_28893:1274-2467(+)
MKGLRWRALATRRPHPKERVPLLESGRLGSQQSISTAAVSARRSQVWVQEPSNEPPTHIAQTTSTCRTAPRRAGAWGTRSVRYHAGVDAGGAIRARRRGSHGRVGRLVVVLKLIVRSVVSVTQRRGRRRRRVRRLPRSGGGRVLAGFGLPPVEQICCLLQVQGFRGRELPTGRSLHAKVAYPRPWPLHLHFRTSILGLWGRVGASVFVFSIFRKPRCRARCLRVGPRLARRRSLGAHDLVPLRVVADARFDLCTRSGTPSALPPRCTHTRVIPLVAAAACARRHVTDWHARRGGCPTPAVGGAARWFAGSARFRTLGAVKSAGHGFLARPCCGGAVAAPAGWIRSGRRDDVRHSRTPGPPGNSISVTLGCRVHGSRTEGAKVRAAGHSRHFHTHGPA